MNSTKKIFLLLTIIVIVCSSVFTQAQFKKGDWLVEGSVGGISFDSGDAESERDTLTNKSDFSSFSFDIYPKAGYFVTNDLAIGLGLGFSFSNSENSGYSPITGVKTSKYMSDNVTLSLAPFLRYYLPANPTTKLRFYGQVEGGFSTDLSRNSEYEYYSNSGAISALYKYDYPSKYFSYYVQPTLGLNYFLAENVAFNGSLGYRYSSSSETYNYTEIPTGATPVKYPDNKTTRTSNDFSWSMGFTMIIP